MSHEVGFCVPPVVVSSSTTLIIVLSSSPPSRCTKLPAISKISSRVKSDSLICCFVPIFRCKIRYAICFILKVVYLAVATTTVIPVLPHIVENWPRRTTAVVVVLPRNIENWNRLRGSTATGVAVGTLPCRAHHGPGRPRPANPSTAGPKRPAAVETGWRRAARVGRELVGVRREPSREERRLLVLLLLLLLLLLERRGGEEAEVLKLLRLAEKLQREERVGRRCRSHGIGGGGEVGDGRWEGGVHGGAGEVRRARVAAGPPTVGLVGVGAGRVEGAHGWPRDDGGWGQQRFWVGF